MKLPILFAALAALALPLPAAAQLQDGTPLVTATTYTVSSKILGGDRKVTVRLPAGYGEEPEVTFPVVYLLDGGPEQDFEHIAGIAQSRDMNGSFDRFILVGIESVNRRHELSPIARDPKVYEEALGAMPGGAPDYRRFLTLELKPLVEKTFRTNGHDAIMGESLAGLFVVETLALEPTLFDTYIAFDPSLWWNRGHLVETARNWIPRVPGSRTLWLAHSSEETIALLTGRLGEILAQGAPGSLTWHVEPMPDETHATIYHPAALKAVRSLLAVGSR